MAVLVVVIAGDGQGHSAGLAQLLSLSVRQAGIFSGLTGEQPGLQAQQNHVPCGEAAGLVGVQHADTFFGGAVEGDPYAIHGALQLVQQQGGVHRGLAARQDIPAGQIVKHSLQRGGVSFNLGRGHDLGPDAAQVAGLPAPGQRPLGQAALQG